MKLDARGMRRAWARAQLLDRTGGERSAEDVVSALVGVQAQDLEAAGLGLRARSTGLSAADLQAALDARSLVLTWSLRGTRHVHAGSDVRSLLTLLGPRFRTAPGRAGQLAIAGDVGEKGVRVLRDSLASEGPLTRRQVKERLAPHGVDPSGQAAIHVIRRAALEGLLCVVPDAGRDERYVLLEDWVPAAPPADAAAALAGLARRYLTAYAPASERDFATWSGLGLSAARRAWSALRGELVEVDEPRGRSWVLADDVDAVRSPGRAAPPLRLLGAFDALLLGHADRSLLVAEEHGRQVNAGGGMIRPVVLAGGGVAGTWSFRGRGSRRHVEVEPFRPLNRREQKQLEGEVADVGRFLGTGVGLTTLLPPEERTGR